MCLFWFSCRLQDDWSDASSGCSARTQKRAGKTQQKTEPAVHRGPLVAAHEPQPDAEPERPAPGPR